MKCKILPGEKLCHSVSIEIFILLALEFRSLSNAVNCPQHILLFDLNLYFMHYLIQIIKFFTQILSNTQFKN